MKKLFLVGAIALSSLFMAGCGAGTGEDQDYLGVKSFANGAKYLRYGDGIVFDIKSAGTNISVTNPDEDGTAVEAGFAKFDGYFYGISSDDTAVEIYCTYTIDSDDTTKAVLTVDMTSVEDSAFNNDYLRKAFGYPTDESTDSGWVTLQNIDTITYTMDFTTGTLTRSAPYTTNSTGDDTTTYANVTTGINFWVMN